MLITCNLQVFLVLVIVAVLLLFITVAGLIVIRRNELERRAAEAAAGNISKLNKSPEPGY